MPEQMQRGSQSPGAAIDSDRRDAPAVRRYGEIVLRRVPLARWIAHKARALLIPHGPKGIRRVGHRRYVGGLWDSLGRLQFEFMRKEGLQPHHYLLDVACGSLRGGVHFIPYLEAGHYLGIDKEESLITAGIEKELGRALYEQKKPRFVVSDSFEFNRFDVRCDYAFAQSLFTHVPAPLIELCFRNLRPHIQEDGVFYATFFETPTEMANPDQPYDHGYFAYSRRQMERFGTAHGWRPAYTGQWGHPRGQVMVRYRPR
jgi:SAM-dependent methyltransferase